MIEPGARAPDFKLRDQDGEEVSLESLRGQTCLLVFYPLDFSPVCTDQLSIYQELLSDFEARDVKLYGVSVDSAFCHKAFQDRLNLTIPLLADFEPKGATARAFGVYDDQWGTSRPGAVPDRSRGHGQMVLRLAERARDPGRQPHLRRP